MRKAVVIAALAAAFLALSVAVSARDRWSLSSAGSGIVMSPDGTEVSDHIEMSGQMVSFVLRWRISSEGEYSASRSLVFPMLRTVPNNTHASLKHKVELDVMSHVLADGKPLGGEKVTQVEIDGFLRTTSRFADGGRDLEVRRTVFPSVEKPLVAEEYVLTNAGGTDVTVVVPEYSETFTTDPSRGVTGAYVIESSLTGCGRKVLKPGESLAFGAVFQGYRLGEAPLPVDVSDELAARERLVRQFDSSLVLSTPDPVMDREFRFAKIRAAESIYRTAGGFLHGPGGESYYAAIWANDQAEYVNPFFPFLGYAVGNESAVNSYRHFARFMNDRYEPIPSSIIAEGKDIWNGAGDRGDAAMIAHGASRYALASGSREEAELLWPLISWCLEYCNRKITPDGVVASDSDELEGRFPSGKANLCTSTLYYDALISADRLAAELGVGNDYLARAERLASAIENYFGAEMGPYHTYRYYDGNDLLRSWICMPLIVGLTERAEGTIAALTSSKLMTEDGLLTQEGSDTFWDRSTLYAIRGIYIAGDTRTATGFLEAYSRRRLLGEHVPYPIEAWPEGGQRHLSAESGLYCRAIVEGMFGLRPTGLRSFDLTPRIAEGWDRMSLNHVRAFGSDFNIEVVRSGRKVKVTVSDNASGKSRTWKSKEGEKISIEI
ncbi:MAG: hypothetical protein MJY84_00435 [Bacteroidales bacterium]|nr:hypothetical protein [Bacteroidales bacterium]